MSVILGGLWSQVVEVRLPKSVTKSHQVAAGTVQRENSAGQRSLNRRHLTDQQGSATQRYRSQQRSQIGLLGDALTMP